MSGLLGLGVVACGDDAGTEEDDPKNPHSTHTRCKPDGGTQSETDAGPEPEPEKETSVQDVQLTNAELTEMCDARGGFMQNHASCAGVNTCRGFTYGDWGEDSQLVEHSCSFVNGCNGVSCVVAQEEPEGGGMTGEEIMKLEESWFIERMGAYSPDPCKTCHVPSTFDDEVGDYVYDFTKLRLMFWPNDTRNKDNWTERSQKRQEAMVAFGVQGFNEDDIHYSNMAGYTKLFSKEEIQRVVEYMRGFDPDDIVAEEILLKHGSDQGAPGDH